MESSRHCVQAVGRQNGRFVVSSLCRSLLSHGYCTETKCQSYLDECSIVQTHSFQSTSECRSQYNNGNVFPVFIKLSSPIFERIYDHLGNADIHARMKNTLVVRQLPEICQEATNCYQQARESNKHSFVCVHLDDQIPRQLDDQMTRYLDSQMTR